MLQRKYANFFKCIFLCTFFAKCAFFCTFDNLTKNVHTTKKCTNLEKLSKMCQKCVKNVSKSVQNSQKCIILKKNVRSHNSEKVQVRRKSISPPLMLTLNPKSSCMKNSFENVFYVQFLTTCRIISKQNLRRYGQKLQKVSENVQNIGESCRPLRSFSYIQ